MDVFHDEGLAFHKSLAIFKGEIKFDNPYKDYIVK